MVVNILLVRLFLETTSAMGNTKAFFFEFVIAFNRIKNLELCFLEMGGYSS